MSSYSTSITVLDYEPTTTEFRDAFVHGLQQRPKKLSSKYFYDHRGSQLFEAICDVPEYYPTRTELAIMHASIREISTAVGPRCLLIEYGSGSSVKTSLLLEAMEEPVAYVPVDISREHLRQSADSLNRAFPDLEVLPVCADFTVAFDVPESRVEPRRRVVYFPGSTIGNFSPPDAVSLLRVMAEECGRDGAVLVGVDLKKDPSVLERAYNDDDGLTAEFNLNLLVRANRELGANFNVNQFQHRALYTGEHDRIEMHLVSRVAQTVRVDGRDFHFRQGESICTEYSHKYDMERFRHLADRAGLAVTAFWTDSRKYFAVVYLVATGGPQDA